MEEIGCNHMGFVVEYSDRYECTKCNDIANKVILKEIEGVWADGQEPQEVLKQRLFENILKIQQENKLKNKKK